MVSEQALIDELRQARASGDRLPDFFIVGHAKCGTTALYETLRGHPKIYMPGLKEPHFLARDPRYSAGSSKRPDTVESYVALFEAAEPGQRAGEASTTYLRSPEAAQRIAELCPDARIIALLREPASFLRSLHLQLLQSGVETEPDFAKAIGLEPSRRRDGDLDGDPLWPRALLYSEHVRYVEQLRRYHERFGKQRVLVLIYEDFRRENEAVVDQVLRFLDVDASLPIQTAEANPTVRVRSRRADELISSVAVGRNPVVRAVKSTLKTVTPERLRGRVLTAARQTVRERDPEPPDEDLMRELRERYRDEVVAAGEYLGRDLGRLWGYDDVR